MAGYHQPLAWMQAFRKPSDLTADDVKEARSYIAGYWPELTRFQAHNDESLIGLPEPYIVPAFDKTHPFDFNEMYYWDTYFIIQGLLDDDHRELVVGMVENLLFLFNRLQVIPNATRTYLAGRSQPPLLSSMVWDVYTAFKLPESWLDAAMKVVEAEYMTVWLGTKKPHIRQVYQGLSRYYDVNHIHDLAEAESGWDMTTRFGRKALDYVPADLNSLLYVYEKDVARYYASKKDTRSAARWNIAASHRAKTMKELMWSNMRGYYMDYNYVKQRRSNLSSLAGYYPLWAGMVDEKQAKQMVKSLRRFEQRGGLVTTDSPITVGGAAEALAMHPVPTQWAYPNGWAPLHYIVVKGLQRYGYHEDARRIAMKWLRTNLQWFNKHGVFLEKYNVVSPGKPPAKGLYPSQVGFGWTNAVFERFCKEFIG